MTTSLPTRQHIKLLENARNRLQSNKEPQTVDGKTYETEMQIDDKLAELREAERAGRD